MAWGKIMAQHLTQRPENALTVQAVKAGPLGESGKATSVKLV